MEEIEIEAYEYDDVSGMIIYTQTLMENLMNVNIHKKQILMVL